MKTKTLFLTVLLTTWAATAMAFDITTTAKVTSIDEWDTGYTKVTIDSTTSCGGTWFWMHRNMEGYNTYMARVLAALMSGRQIRITERAPAWCTDSHLYNPRIGNM